MRSWVYWLNSSFHHSKPLHINCSVVLENKFIDTAIYLASAKFNFRFDRWTQDRLNSHLWVPGSHDVISKRSAKAQLYHPEVQVGAANLKHDELTTWSYGIIVFPVERLAGQWTSGTVGVLYYAWFVKWLRVSRTYSWYSHFSRLFLFGPDYLSKFCQ